MQRQIRLTTTLLAMAFVAVATATAMFALGHRQLSGAHIVAMTPSQSLPVPRVQATVSALPLPTQTVTVTASPSPSATATASIAATGYAPACPKPAFGADGGMGPIFCVIDNPKALDYYRTMGRRTFALGPDATPIDVESALRQDYAQGGTYPIICAVYQLAAWRNHWTFGVSPAEQYGGCSGPDFSSVN